MWVQFWVRTVADITDAIGSFTVATCDHSAIVGEVTVIMVAWSKIS